MAIFPTVFLRQYRPGKCVLRYSRTDNRLFRLLKEEVQKVEKVTFFQLFLKPFLDQIHRLTPLEKYQISDF